MRLSFVVLAFCCVFSSSSIVQGGVIKTLFLGYDENVASAYGDIMGAVDSDARFDYSNSTFIEDQSSSFVPTLAQLQQYDSVLVWSNYGPAPGLGDTLADYVDGGGGVVLATFDGYFADGVFSGRILSHGYNPFTGPTSDAYSSRSLGAFNGSSPLMAGVSALSAVLFSGDWTGVDSGASIAASWNDGRPLAGISANGLVANISLFPNVATFGHATGDYQQLFRNALATTANPSFAAVPEPSSFAIIGAIGAFGVWKRRRSLKVA